MAIGASLSRLYLYGSASAQQTEPYSSARDCELLAHYLSSKFGFYRFRRREPRIAENLDTRVATSFASSRKIRRHSKPSDQLNPTIVAKYRRIQEIHQLNRSACLGNRQSGRIPYRQRLLPWPLTKLPQNHAKQFGNCFASDNDLAIVGRYLRT